jgi:hypothetical protein
MKEGKEQLLMKVESAAIWRASLKERFPDDSHNLTASEYLSKLQEYLETLPEDHLIFYWYWKLMSTETEIEKVNDEVRSYGYQNPEKPEKFIDRILIGLQS